MSHRLALFGGSFNPPHLGHVLNVACTLSCLDVERVLVLPTFEHAFAKQLAPFPHRLAMTRLAMAPFGERVETSDLEARLGGPSRTIRSIDALRAERPDAKLVLVVGSDILLEIDRWYDSQRLLSLVELAVLRRGGYASEDPRQFGPSIPEISSSELRTLLANRKLAACEPHMPRSVLAYADDHALYR